MRDCNCPDPALCRRLRIHISGTLWERWTCQCPPERPCDEVTCAKWRLALESSVEKRRPLTPEGHHPDAQRPRWVKVRRLLRFAWAMLKHAAAGWPKIRPEDQAARRAVCLPCTHRDKETDQCTKCRCNTGAGKRHLIEKTAIPGEQCPVYGKEEGPWWGPVKGETVWARLWRLTGSRV